MTTTKAQEIVHKLRDHVAFKWDHAVKALENHLKSSKETETRVNDTLQWARDVQKYADQLQILDTLVMELFNEDA